jgi:hypothetical protein
VATFFADCDAHKRACVGKSALRMGMINGWEVSIDEGVPVSVAFIDVDRPLRPFCPCGWQTRQ